MQEKKMPLIRLAKRDSMDPRKVWTIRLGSILIALLLGSLVILITGNNPFTAYGTMISGALGKNLIDVVFSTMNCLGDLVGTVIVDRSEKKRTARLEGHSEN